MKIQLCIVAIFCALVLVECIPSPQVIQRMGECAKEVGLPAESMSGAPNFDDPKVKCFGACLLKKAEDMVDGKVVIEKAVACAKSTFPEVPAETLTSEVTECANKANEEKEECDIGGVYFKCFFEKRPFPL